MAIKFSVDLVFGSLQVKFPYSQESINVIKTLGAARWDAATKSWLLPYSQTTVESLKQHFPCIEFGKFLKKELGATEANSIEAETRKYIPAQKDIEIKDFKFKTEPLWHQKISFNFARALDQCGLFLEQGLGKTFIAICLATWRFRKGQVKRVLYVCPNSVVPQWETEDVTKHLHDDFNAVTILSGSTKDRIKVLEKLYLSDYIGWIILNYEALLGLEDYLLKVQSNKVKMFQMMVMDESSKIKHASAERSKISWRLGRTITYRNIMTGTPITQTAEDAFSQFRFLKESIFGPYATAFRGQYLIMGGFEMRQVIGYRNIGDFFKKLFSVSIRFTKDMCLNLPPKIYERRTAVLDDDLSSRYRVFEKECIAEFAGKEISAPLVMTKIMKLSQITGGFVYEQGADGKRIAAHEFKKNAKMKVLEEVLEEVLPNKIIIWCRFTQEIQMITTWLTENKVKFVAIHGAIKTDERGLNVQQFQTDPDTHVFVGQVNTAGLGITLTAASYVIYYSNTYSLEDRLQSEDRCHRIGQNKSVTYIDIVAQLANGRRTIDHDVLDVIKGKASFANEVSTALVKRMVDREAGKEIKNPSYNTKHKKNSDTIINEEDEFKGEEFE